MVILIDIGLGNGASVRNMFARLGIEVEQRSNPTGLTEKHRYVLPGVGSFDEGVTRLHDTGWFNHLQQLPQETPLLGICLGMQLLCSGSAEGRKEGLQRIDAFFERFGPQIPRVPHMGWNKVLPAREESLLGSEPGEWRFYFSHSYRTVGEPGTFEVGRTYYGDWFSSIVQKGNTIGLQFHPEKSHRFGMQLLRRWVETTC